MSHSEPLTEALCPRCGLPAHRQMESPTACVNTLRGELETSQQEAARYREAMKQADELLAGMWSYNEEGRATLREQSNPWWLQASDVLRQALQETP